MMITPPAQSDYPSFYHTYVSKVEENDLLPALGAEMNTLTGLLENLDSDGFEFRYAPGKWSLKELLIHMSDTERIFAYRALRFARRDQTPLAGFEQEDYGQVVSGTSRDGHHILGEFQAVRKASVMLYESFEEDDLNAVGTASNGSFTVRAQGYIILGHARHHRQIIEEKYLK